MTDRNKPEILKKLMRRSQTLRLPEWTFALALALTGVFAYGLLIPFLGFYWDDWAKIGVNRLFGLNGYWAYYAEDRPLSGWTHIVFTFLLGERPIAWQIFQFVLILLSAWGVYRLVCQIWPRARWQAAVSALLFLVYPAFIQHPIAVTFHQQWLQYTLILFSFLFMARAVRQPQVYWPFTALSLLFSLLQLSITEYFAPLELLRPLILWLVLTDLPPTSQTLSMSRRLSALLKQYIPFLLAIILYAVWRLFLIDLSGSDPYQAVMLYGLLKEPLPTLLALARVFLQDSLYVLVTVWGPLFNSGTLGMLTPFQWVSLFISALSAITGFVFLTRVQFKDHGESDVTGWAKEAFWLGFAAFTLGVLPAWITGREVVFDFHSNRYALPGVLGASLMWTALIDALTPKRVSRAFLVAVLIGVSTGLHLRVGNEYRWVWEQQTRFFWQLYWRAPALEPGTALLTYDEVFPEQGLFSSSAALNLLYPQEKNQEHLAYWWYTLTPRYDLNRLPEPLAFGFSTQFRSYTFVGGTPKTLLINADSSQGNCLHVVSEEDLLEPGLPPLVKAVAPISNLNLIGAEPLNDWRPPEALFGPEPQHSWCYFFEKADLANQLKDWTRSAELADHVRELGYTPLSAGADTPYGWKPFIKGYAQAGRWQDAVDLTLQASQRGVEYWPPLCALWQSLDEQAATTIEKNTALDAVYQQLSCNVYLK